MRKLRSAGRTAQPPWRSGSVAIVALVAVTAAASVLGYFGRPRYTDHGRGYSHFVEEEPPAPD